MHMADDFDLVALDFCITYEVSPPGWTPAKCAVALLDATASAFMSASSSLFAEADLGPSSLGSESMSLSPEHGDGAPSAELAGVLGTNAEEALATLDPTSAQTIQIDCSRLVRIDFAAAGALLNWTIERHAQGRAVVFLGLHRLIALFLGVVGVTGHATVAVRRD
jgi:ABC-type transporter Mla MlaB component